MESHPHFDLRLHSDGELAEFVGEPLIERVTLHEWPLSCVQLVTGASGRKWIYKTESGPTVEHRFYAQARSPLLPNAKTIIDKCGYVSLLIDYIGAPHFDPTGMSEEGIVQTGRALLSSIAQIEGELPAYWVVDSAHWGSTSDEMIGKLSALVDDAAFSDVGPADLATIGQACDDPALPACLDHNIGLVHGDLTAGNVLVEPGTSTVHKLIDWQYVLRGPRRLDLAIFLDSLDIDPTPYVGPHVLRLMLLMRIHWLVECATHWFVPGVPTYDRQIATLCRRLDVDCRGLDRGILEIDIETD